MEQIAENVFIETAFQGVNVGAILTQEGVVCVDVPSYPRDARSWVAKLQHLTYQAIRYVILTDCHGDRILNTRWLNAPILMHQAAARRLRSYDRRYPQRLIESLISRNPTHGRELSSYPVKHPSISFNKRMRLSLGKCDIELLHAPGPSEGNTWVHLPQHRLIFTGDCVVSNSHPRLAEASSEKWLKSLERLDQFEHPIEILVPGRGNFGNREQVEQVRAFVQQARRFMRECLQEGNPNGGTAVIIEHLLTAFPLGDAPLEWTQAQIKLGLEHLYDEIKLAEANRKLSA